MFQTTEATDRERDQRIGAGSDPERGALRGGSTRDRCGAAKARVHEKALKQIPEFLRKRHPELWPQSPSSILLDTIPTCKQMMAARAIDARSAAPRQGRNVSRIQRKLARKTDATARHAG